MKNKHATPKKPQPTPAEDDVLRRMLGTPPKPHDGKPIAAKKAAPPKKVKR